MLDNKIKKVLIANRGEISLRVQRACRELGIESVCIASEADKNSLFIRQSQAHEIIGPAAAKDSYLNIDKILAAALKHGCDALHPGYGFLSENAEFAQRTRDAGLIFIGPEPKTIKIMGSKTLARAQVTSFGVPCTPGSEAGLADEALVNEAKRIGFPVIIKAVFGGGGRGMRIVTSSEELQQVLPQARAEVKKNFGDEAVYLEKYIHKPRHIEVQVIGDHHGRILHLGTRDCSSQRRHQKLIEEAPAANLSDELRAGIEQAAVLAAKSVDYRNAGTVEFLVSGESFYFLEMNTRIQVEHPVTEMVTGVDLVQLQIKIAQGEPIPFTQDEVRFDGHAIEFRINAENPSTNFSPQVGLIQKLVRPTQGPVVDQPDYIIREDFGYEAGDEISIHYDSLISKLVVKAPTRAQAILKSEEILRSYVLEGLETSVAYHRWMTYNPSFRKGIVDIGFVEREFSAESLRELRARNVQDPRYRDPRHRSASGGMQAMDSYGYESKKYNTNYTIEVLHCSDGYFIGRAVDEKGRRMKRKDWRMSNGMDTVVKSVVSLLETTPPSELFTD